MKVNKRKVLASILALVMCVASTTTAYSEIGGGGDGSRVEVFPSNGGVSNATRGVTRGWGVRVTFTSSAPLLESGVSELTGAYNETDLTNQFDNILNVASKRYIEPGVYGLNYYTGTAPLYGVHSSETLGIVDIRKTRRGMSGSVTPIDPNLNKLAWMCYYTSGDRPTDRPTGDATYAYQQDIFNMIFSKDAFAAAGDPGAWLDSVKSAYLQKAGEGAGAFISRMDKIMVPNGAVLNDNFGTFTWSSRAEISQYGTAMQKVQWSKLGYVTALMQVAWAAQEAGDMNTYSDMANKLAAWAQTGYMDSTLMPVVMFEATNCVSVDGSPDSGKWMMMTLPFTMQMAYSGGVASQLYAEWPAECIGETDKALLTLTKDLSCVSSRQCQVQQGIGYYPLNGTQVFTTQAASWHGRTYLRNLWSIGTNPNLFGYIHNWTYLSDTPVGDPGSPTGGDAMGSFTWDLTPKGVTNVTPDEEVNESSTLYDINMSQSGHNNNNYKEWETTVIADGSNDNKIRVNIYRVSQSLNEGQKATEYARGTVKAAGADVLHTVDRVVNGTGDITNIPVIGNLKAGDDSRSLTDEEFLTIIRTATGMSYNETIVGSLDKGIRVTYAVYIDVNPGMKGWKALSNNQAEFIEYRSTPGIYSYLSDSPTGYAEIKCGYFDSDKYNEPFEAMAGFPTTENMYFASGGQEFVAQLEYKYVTDKDTVRSYEQRYTTEVCDGWYDTTEKKAWDNVLTADINAWSLWSTLIEGENQETCDECNYVHYAGASPKETPYATSKSGTGGVTLNFGTGVWNQNLSESSWDWHADGIDSHCTDGCETDPVTGEESHDDCDGAEAADVSDSSTQPPDITCDCGDNSSSFYKVRVTRWTGKAFAQHKDYNTGHGTQHLTSSIKFTQNYNDMNYAQIVEAHVWRLEKSRVEGIKQMTFGTDDFVLGVAEDLSNVIFNVAEADNAKEGRMYYMLHPSDGDNFIFKNTLKTRGCCHCYNHNAAADLIASPENPNKLTEQAWCISDYLILEATRAKTSLLYHQYSTENTTIPILEISVSDDLQDNSYTVVREDGSSETRDWDDLGDYFSTRPVSFNTVANAVNGTENAICENRETYKGAPVSVKSLSWGGYNGDYGGTTIEDASSDDGPDDVQKFRGKSGTNNFTAINSKKIFKEGYQHSHNGEVNGFSTNGGVQKLTYPNSPFVLSVNDIDVHNTKVNNGKKEFHDSTIFYHNIISWGDAPHYPETEDAVYKDFGFRRDTNYYGSTGGINDVVIHNPVSTQYARLIPLPSDLDQRVYDTLVSDSLNEDNGKCPGKPNACKYAYLSCEYKGTRYHTDECYTEVRGQGLASIPVTGNQTTVMQPITTITRVSGNKQFGYTGDVQTFTAPGTGTYTFEVWGAQGGDGYASNTAGGQGGYAKGTYNLKKDQTIYIYVGEKGAFEDTTPTFNGGGSAGQSGSLSGGSGGGATDIRVGGQDFASNAVIVAGGGGGGSHNSSGYAGGTLTDKKTNLQGSNAYKHRGGGGGHGGGQKGGDNSGGNGCSVNGTGGYNYTGGVQNSVSQVGGRYGHGLARITWVDAAIETISYIPAVSGDFTYDTTQAKVYPVTLKPEIYTAEFSGYYSVHLFGSAGGGAKPGTSSAGGLGGYAAGQVYLNKGEQILVTVGSVGSNAGTVGAGLSGGYNGGGNGGATSGGGFGGGGATDIVKSFTYHNGIRMNTMSNNALLNGTQLNLTNPGAYYDGPRVPATNGRVYRVDFYGTNLDKATFTNNAGTEVHRLVTSEHAQIFYQATTTTSDMRIKVDGNSKVYLNEVYVADMATRLLVAGGGGGADNAGGVLNGADDGRGGIGGGLTGGDGYTDGQKTYRNGGGKPTSGFKPGVGQDSASGDAGGGGAGWWGGMAGVSGNSGGGGGSSYLGQAQYAITNEGVNDSAGYAVIVLPGMGNTDYTHMLTCSEQHHAPNSNWHRYTDGWIHTGGYVCTGITCPHCPKGTALSTNKGYAWTPSKLNTSAYIIKHDGKYHLTDGADNHCDECDEDIIFDKYTLDGVNRQDCVWKATSSDGACYNTSNATNPQYHYSVGDDICYDACMDDNNHKINDDLAADTGDPNRAGQFVILDHGFQVYFPDIGDFYGNGVLGIRNTQKPEGFGYIDDMPTTPWLREKYVVFPFDVTYRGHTYIGGTKILLGSWDAATEKWTDDNPGEFIYDFHCLLSNNEYSAAEIKFVAIANNTPNADNLENLTENRNYTRYGSNIRAYHDANRNYFIDVVGRIGVLSMLDTGDFRFSNYYKQVVDSWKVEEVVKDVDISKQNFVSVDQKTIFNDPISVATNGQNTWGLTDWMEPMDKLQAFPLTPGKNNVPALKNQAHRIGYSDYLSLVTIGNYYGENSKDDNNKFRVQIQPYYYHYDLNTKVWTPVDVYIKTGDSYKMINDYGTLNSTTDYNFYYNLDWEAEHARRMYTDEEEAATRKVQNNWYQLWDIDSEPNNINIPSGINTLHGTANMLFLRDKNRTFIGTRYRYGDNTETDFVIPEQNFNRQAQRWHFTLGLPSTAAFVKAGEAGIPENMSKLSLENGVIVCALQIYAKGNVWTLKYSGTPMSERSFYLFDGNTTLISWHDAGEAGPEDKQVIAVYTNSKTSRDDLLTEGSH